MFLGVSADVTNSVEERNDWSAYSLILQENPLVDYVDLPKSLQGLYFSNMICGVIRGALEAVRKGKF
jgi:hypothetical protein